VTVTGVVFVTAALTDMVMVVGVTDKTVALGSPLEALGMNNVS
jgi:hypothetical protein